MGKKKKKSAISRVAMRVATGKAKMKILTFLLRQPVMIRKSRIPRTCQVLPVVPKQKVQPSHQLQILPRTRIRTRNRRKQGILRKHNRYSRRRQPMQLLETTKQTRHRHIHRHKYYLLLTNHPQRTTVCRKEPSHSHRHRHHHYHQRMKNLKNRLETTTNMVKTTMQVIPQARKKLKWNPQQVMNEDQKMKNMKKTEMQPSKMINQSRKSPRILPRKRNPRKRKSERTKSPNPESRLPKRQSQRGNHMDQWGRNVYKERGRVCLLIHWTNKTSILHLRIRAKTPDRVKHHFLCC
mmetsp:Transcript_4996/g.11882  ORF Transcript_4996/g.11882 Transcript_4996/m.11882 type:complete len:294 (-) Transcript_4996:3078-3959(-)